MRVLVTGGTGFIGSHLAEHVLRSGHQAIVLGLADLVEEQHNVDLLKSLGVEIFEGSITDTSVCEMAIRDATHVFHLAVAMREAGVSDDYFEEINLEGTRNLLNLSVERNLHRFIYCSTIGIYGHRVAGITNEESPLSPGNIYEQTKVSAEMLVAKFHRDSALPTVVLRPADVYGPRDHRLLKMFRAIAKGKFPLFGDGNGRRHMVYVDDVVEAFMRACISDDAVGQSMIIAGPEVCTLNDLVSLIQQAMSQKRFGYRFPLKPMLLIAAVVEDVCTALRITPPIYRRRMDFFHSDSEFDISRAKSLLSWKPETSLVDGIYKTLAAYKASGLIN